MQPPQARHGFRIDQLEDSFLPIGPLDITGAVVSVLQQFQQELPQVRCRACRHIATHVSFWTYTATEMPFTVPALKYSKDCTEHLCVRGFWLKVVINLLITSY